MDGLIAAGDLAYRAASIGSSMFCSLEWWRCFLPPSLQNFLSLASLEASPLWDRALAPALP